VNLPTPRHVLDRMIVIACVLLLAGACSGRPSPVVEGDAENGRLLLRQFGCGSCHRIPGVATAEGNVGPSLDAIARRVYLAGVLPNTPDNMVRWIRSPKSVDPRTAMPDLQVTEMHARDMTAYLYRLQ
jgi:cytochrome c